MRPSPTARSLTPWRSCGVGCRSLEQPRRMLLHARRQSADQMTAHQRRDTLVGDLTPMPATGRTAKYVARRADRPQVSPCRRTCTSNTDRPAHDAARRSNARRLVTDQPPDGKNRTQRPKTAQKSATVVLIPRAHPQGRTAVTYVPKQQHGNKRQHGRASYRRGCRCERCRHAEASYRKQHRKTTK